MHRIDGPGATVDHKFTDGDPVGGIQATMVTDDWLNDVQEELMSILAAASVSPVKGTQNQALTAIRALIAAFLPKRSFATNDYIRIPDVPGGLIIQFGTQNYSGSATTVITYPIPFPTANLADALVGGAGTFIGGVSRTLSTRTINAAVYPSTTNAPNTSTFTWIAIGY